MRPNIGEDLIRLRMREIQERVGCRRLRDVARGRNDRRRPERNPDERPRLDSYDDWILFGPRMH
jgi:hypothetical protein